MNEIFEGKKRMMVLVPHQDDEVLAAAGVIRHAILCGINIEVVMVTNGDYEGQNFSVGRLRLKESMAALKVLGLEEDHFHILGYADTGMPEKESFLSGLFKESDVMKIHPSHCASETYSLEEKPEYHLERKGTHGSYNRATLKADLKGILTDCQPDLLITTADCDFHGDHSGLFCFVKECLKEFQEEGKALPDLYVSLIHSCAGDDNWPERETEMFSCPEGLEDTSDLKWKKRVRVPVPEEMMRAHGKENLKYRALCKYEFALEPGAYDFLMAFIKNEEIFWKIEITE